MAEFASDTRGRSARCAILARSRARPRRRSRRAARSTWRRARVRAAARARWLAGEKVNKGGGLAKSGQEGALWWMDRQFEDAKKYMSKKQIAKMEAQRARRTASLSERALPTAP